MTVKEIEETSTPEDVADQIDTPHGTLYKPRNGVLQFLTLIGVFVAGPGVGWLVAWFLGGVSETAQILLYLPFVAILFLGYGLWSARLKAIAFEMIGKGILRALFLLIIKRKKPQKLEDVLPTKERLEKMAVRAQKAASSFLLVALPTAVAMGLLSAFFESPSSTLVRVAVVFGACCAWGWLLSFLARRGYLPILEEGG